jgi:hypothetical protein
VQKPAAVSSANGGARPNPLKSHDFQTLRAPKAFLCRATKYSLPAGVRHRRVVEIKKKKLSFETAVT